VDLNKNCGEYTKLDIRSFRWSRWRNYDATFVWLKLERICSTQ